MGPGGVARSYGTTPLPKPDGSKAWSASDYEANVRNERSAHIVTYRGEIETEVGSRSPGLLKLCFPFQTGKNSNNMIFWCLALGMIPDFPSVSGHLQPHSPCLYVDRQQLLLLCLTACLGSG